MAQQNENRPIDGAVELLKTNGFDGLAEAVTVLLNSAMVAERSEHLGVAPAALGLAGFTAPASPWARPGVAYPVSWMTRQPFAPPSTSSPDSSPLRHMRLEK